MIFYNGFNLLVDIILVIATIKATVSAMKAMGYTEPPF